MAEVLLQDAFASRGVAAEVQSSGTVAAGKPAAGEVIELMAARGLDASAHRSQLTTPELLGWADLVLAMASDHLKEAVVLAPDAFERTFLYRELVAAIEEKGPRQADESIAQYLARVGDGRTKADFLRVSSDLDVPDPIGRRMKVFRATAAELDDLTARLVEGLWPGQADNVASAVG